MSRLLLAALLGLQGCAVVQPYYSVGLVAPINSQTDWYLQPKRDWTCSSPWFDAEAGAEWKSGVRLGVYHLSAIQCGTFNDSPELYYTGFRLSYQGGGWK